MASGSYGNGLQDLTHPGTVTGSIKMLTTHRRPVSCHSVYDIQLHLSFTAPTPELNPASNNSAREENHPTDNSSKDSSDTLDSDSRTHSGIDGIDQHPANGSNDAERDAETSGPQGTPPSSGTTVREPYYYPHYLRPQICNRLMKLTPVKHRSSTTHCNDLLSILVYVRLIHLPSANDPEPSSSTQGA